MKDEEFLAKLSEVAEWKIPTSPAEDTVNKRKKRGRKSLEEIHLEQQEQEFNESGGVNNTLAPMLLKLKNLARDCEDCGKFCENGRTVNYKMHISNGCKHWREHCATCGRNKDPYTGKFTLANGTASSVKWNSFFKETKGLYKTQGNQRRSENSVEIIRKYPDTKDPI